MKLFRLLVCTVIVLTITSCNLFQNSDTVLGDNIISNSGFEDIKTAPNTEYIQTSQPTTDGLANGWYLSWSNLPVKTSIITDSKNGLYAQRIEVAENPSDIQDEYRSMVFAGDSISQLKPNTNYKLSAWVKGKGSFAFSLILNNYAFVKFANTLALTTNWSSVTFDVTTPSEIKSIDALFRVFDSNNWGNVNIGDWVIIDDLKLQEVIEQD